MPQMNRVTQDLDAEALLHISYTPLTLIIVSIIASVFALSIFRTDSWFGVVVWHVHRLVNDMGLLAVVYGMVIAMQQLVFVPMLPVSPLAYYVVFRFVLVESLAERPVLYLRSFALSDVAMAFGRIVAPVASRFGVVVGLTHSSQGAAAVYSQTPWIARPLLDTAADAVWKEWVLGKLSNCSAAILELSRVTEGLSWEMEQAIKSLPRHKIVAIRQSSNIPPSVDLTMIEYTLDKQGMRSACEKLDAVLYRATRPRAQSARKLRSILNGTTLKRVVVSGILLCGAWGLVSTFQIVGEFDHAVLGFVTFGSFYAIPTLLAAVSFKMPFQEWKSWLSLVGFIVAIAIIPDFINGSSKDFTGGLGWMVIEDSKITAIGAVLSLIAVTRPTYRR